MRKTANSMDAQPVSNGFADDDTDIDHCILGMPAGTSLPELLTLQEKENQALRAALGKCHQTRMQKRPRARRSGRYRPGEKT